MTPKKSYQHLLSHWCNALDVTIFQLGNIYIFLLMYLSCHKTGLEKSIPMILRLEIILWVVSHRRIEIIFYNKNLKLTKNDT